MSILFGHHIIPKHFRGHSAFRGIDKQKFDIDSPANRIYLPADRNVAAEVDAPPHPGPHVSSYMKAVCKRLDEIAKIEGADDRLAKIKTLIDAMRVGFDTGDLHTNVPIGKTREEVDVGIAKVFDEEAFLNEHPDHLKKIRDLEQRGIDTGLYHLIKWLLFLGNPERQRKLDEVIRRNPDEKLTAGNRDIEGTPWSSKFAVLDPSSSLFRLPGSTPVNPNDFPPLPGYHSPSLNGLNEQEGFARSDPRSMGALPAFPAPSRDEQQFGQLPPSTVTPSDPLVLKFDPATGFPLPFSERSPILDPDAPSTSTPPNALYGAAGIAALMAVTPALWPLWGMLGFGLASAAPAHAADAEGGAARNAGSAFSADTTDRNAFAPNGPAPQTSGNNSSGLMLASPPEESNRKPERASTFADRFGKWIDTPGGSMPAQDAPVVSPISAAGAVAPDEVRRLTRANASNAGSVFESGSAPVPYLTPMEFNDRFGRWSMPIGESQQQARKPIGAFADEPSYMIPPPIFGVDGTAKPRSDADEWFSRWIGPLLPPQ